VGIGKQRLALWLAQYLMCQAPGDSEPCGKCGPCRLTLRLEHPDVHWFFPLPRPKSSGGSERLGEALEDARAAELAARRENPHQPTMTGEPVGIYLAHVQVLRRLTYTRPAAGSRKVFVIGQAEHLVPQEASPEAANALLKVLEEPPPDTNLVLTASDPDALLPTLRSRLLPIRVRPLAETDVAAFLVEVTGADPEKAVRAARLGQGSIGRALAFLPTAEGPGGLEEIRQEARALIDAAIGPPAARVAAAHALSPSGARGASFAGLLEHINIWLRDLAATATGAEEFVINADAVEWLRATARRLPAGAGAIPAAVRAVDAAAQLGQFNVNPQLTVAWLLRSLRQELASAST
jgi:DNA polymerase-3 subunit delta'